MLSQQEEKQQQLTSYLNYFEIVETGKKLHQEAKYAEASAEYIKAILLHPEVADAHYHMGENFEKAQSPEKAFHSYNKALELNPKHRMAIQRRANLMTDPNEAKPELDKAYQLQDAENTITSTISKTILKYTNYSPSATQSRLVDKTYNTEYVINARLTAEQENYYLAIAYYMLHLKNYPDDFISLYAISSLFGILNDPTAAIDFITQTLKISDYAPAHLTNATLYHNNHQTAEAVTAIINSLKWSNENDFDLIEKTGDKDFILKLLHQDIELKDPDPQLDLLDSNNEIITLIQRGEPTKALALCYKLSTVYPGRFSYHILAAIHLDLKNAELARFAYSMAIWFKQEESIAYIERAKINFLLGHIGCAITDIYSAVNCNSRNKQAEIFEEMGNFLIRYTEQLIEKNELQKAIKPLEIATGILKLPPLYQKLAELLLAAGHVIEAKSFLEHGAATCKSQDLDDLKIIFETRLQQLENKKDSRHALHAWKPNLNEETYTATIESAKKLFAQKNFKNAEIEIKKAMAICPELSEAYFQYALFYEQENKKDKALLWYLKTLQVFPTHHQAISKCALIQNSLGNKELFLKYLDRAKFSKKIVNQYEEYCSLQYTKYCPKESTSTDPLFSLLNKCDVESSVLGGLALNCNAMEIAIYYFNIALKHYPDDFLALTARGEVYFKIGAKEYALKDFDKAIELNSFARAYRARAQLHSINGNRELARADLVNAIKFGGKSDFESYDLAYSKTFALILLNECKDRIIVDEEKNEALLKSLSENKIQNISEPTQLLERVEQLTELINSYPTSTGLYEARGEAYNKLEIIELAQFDFSIAIWLEHDKNNLIKLLITRSNFNLALGLVGLATEDLVYARTLIYHDKKIDSEKLFTPMADSFATSCLKLASIEISKNDDPLKALQYLVPTREFIKRSDILLEIIKTLILLKDYDNANNLLEEEKKFINEDTVMTPKFMALKEKLHRKIQDRNSSIMALEEEKSTSKKNKSKKLITTQKFITPSRKKNPFHTNAANKSDDSTEQQFVSDSDDTSDSEKISKIDLEKEQNRRNKNRAKARRKKELKAIKRNKSATPTNEDKKSDNESLEIEITPSISIPTLFDINSTDLESYIPKTIPFLAPEKYIFDRIEFYNQMNNTNHIVYGVGGSVFDRVLEIFYNNLTTQYETLTKSYTKASIDKYLASEHFDRVRDGKNILCDDIDMIVDMPATEVLKLFSNMKPIEDINVSGLIKINLGFIKIDILCTDSLVNLRNDWKKRDFAPLYVNKNQELIDPAFGKQDLIKGQLRSVLPADEAIKSDPIRSLRAIYQSTKRGLTIHRSTYNTIKKTKELLIKVAPGKVNAFIKKLLSGTHTEKNYSRLLELEFFNTLFPSCVNAAIPKHQEWLALQRECTSVFSHVRQIYAPYIIAAAIDAMPPGVYFNETIFVHAKNIILQSPLFSQAFLKFLYTDKLNLNDELLPFITSWKQFRVNQQASLAAPEPSVKKVTLC